MASLVVPCPPGDPFTALHATPRGVVLAGTMMGRVWRWSRGEGLMLLSSSQEDAIRGLWADEGRVYATVGDLCVVSWAHQGGGERVVRMRKRGSNTMSR